MEVLRISVIVFHTQGRLLPLKFSRGGLVCTTRSTPFSDVVRTICFSNRPASPTLLTSEDLACFADRREILMRTPLLIVQDFLHVLGRKLCEHFLYLMLRYKQPYASSFVHESHFDCWNEKSLRS